MARKPVSLRIEPDPEQKSKPTKAVPEWKRKLLWDPKKEVEMKSYECVGPLPANAPVWVAMFATRGENILGPGWEITSDWGRTNEGSLWQSWTATRK